MPPSLVVAAAGRSSPSCLLDSSLAEEGGHAPSTTIDGQVGQLLYELRDHGRRVCVSSGQRASPKSQLRYHSLAQACAASRILGNHLVERALQYMLDAVVHVVQAPAEEEESGSGISSPVLRFFFPGNDRHRSRVCSKAQSSRCPTVSHCVTPRSQALFSPRSYKLSPL